MKSAWLWRQKHKRIYGKTGDFKPVSESLISLEVVEGPEEPVGSSTGCSLTNTEALLHHPQSERNLRSLRLMTILRARSRDGRHGAF